jgi:hypothetical protein
MINKINKERRRSLTATPESHDLVICTSGKEPMWTPNKNRTGQSTGGGIITLIIHNKKPFL